jgi:hypothetical protein
MLRAAFVLVVVGGLFAAPLLCDVGVAAHACACDSADCCAEEAACELDTCDDVYKTEDWRKQCPVAAPVAALPIVGQETSADGMNLTVPTSSHHPSRNQPFPTSDLPLRI